MQKKNKSLSAYNPDLIEDIYDFKCPISLETFKYPVIAEDGMTYEEKHIKAWFKKNNDNDKIKSPITGNLMGKKIIQNYLIKTIILAYREKYSHIYKQDLLIKNLKNQILLLELEINEINLQKELKLLEHQKKYKELENQKYQNNRENNCFSCLNFLQNLFETKD